uniref:Tudor domain-containing protein n=1 Tax=Globisporangium ultimum (strain ATCC 200006 / CBS 805.95 / DAOM BR144) TaxID=431595 RepID=K3X7F7_GLOUD
MKPSKREEELKGDDDDAANRHARRGKGNFENRKHAFRVGSRVERELDGLWFPATVVGVDDDGLFELEYDEDHNHEMDISADELRHLDENVQRPKTPALVPTLTPQQRELMRKDSLLFQSTTDYDPNKMPTVVLHHQGESHAASGYIINGLENNIAAGNGLRGIRWLRVNTL